MPGCRMKFGPPAVKGPHPLAPNQIARDLSPRSRAATTLFLAALQAETRPWLILRELNDYSKKEARFFLAGFFGYPGGGICEVVGVSFPPYSYARPRSCVASA